MVFTVVRFNSQAVRRDKIAELRDVKTVEDANCDQCGLMSWLFLTMENGKDHLFWSSRPYFSKHFSFLYFEY